MYKYPCGCEIEMIKEERWEVTRFCSYHQKINDEDQRQIDNEQYQMEN